LADKSPYTAEVEWALAILSVLEGNADATKAHAKSGLAGAKDEGVRRRLKEVAELAP
jgi:hypothetical protein